MELLDIYNENREKTGRTVERGTHVCSGDFILVVHVWIVNSKGEYLIQKRQPWKKPYPNLWDCATAGAAALGDDSAMAAYRESKEELGIDIDMTRAEMLFTDKFSFGFDDIWLVKQNINIEDITLQTEEVANIRWASEKDIRNMAVRGEFIDYYYLDDLFSMIRSRL
ncbi:MAG: NUDIX hydrolase [Solirubrobacterales bacterium]